MTLNSAFGACFGGERFGYRSCGSLLDRHRSRRNRRRDRLRFKLYLARRAERARMLRESRWCRDACELVAVDMFLLHNVSPGEVLFDQSGYVSPSLGVL